MGATASLEVGGDVAGDAIGDAIGDEAGEEIADNVSKSILDNLLEDGDELSPEDNPDSEASEDEITARLETEMSEESIDSSIDSEVSNAGGGTLSPAARQILKVGVLVGLAIGTIVCIDRTVTKVEDKKELAKKEGAEIKNLTNAMKAGIVAGKVNVKTWNDLLTRAKEAGKLEETVDIPDVGKVAVTLSFSPTFEDVAQTFLSKTLSALLKFLAALKATASGKAKTFPIAAAKVAQQAYVTQAQNLIATLEKIQASSENKVVLAATGIDFNDQLPGLKSNLTAVHSITITSS